jgi:hypothetical protein
MRFCAYIANNLSELNFWNISCGEFYLLGYNVVESVENQPAFRKNALPPSSTFNLEDAENTFLINASKHLPDYMTSHPTRL